MHPAGLPQLPHAGVHQGIAGAPLLPGLQFGVRRRLPGKVVELPAVVLRGQVRILVQQLPAELTPAELAPEDPDVGRRVAREAFPEGMPDTEGTDLAEAQVRGEAAGALDARQVPARAIVLHGPVQEIVQPVVGAVLARGPRCGQTAAPVRLAGEEPPAVQPVAGGRATGRSSCGLRQMVRGIGRKARFRTGHAGTPERCEDLVWPAGAGAHRPRLEQQVCLEAGGLNALPGGPLLDGRRRWSAPAGRNAGSRTACRRRSQLPDPR